MFEKIGQSAEKVVSKVGVSRRGFLGRAAKLAAAVGAAIAGLMPSPTEAGGYKRRCRYYCPDGTYVGKMVPPYKSCRAWIRTRGMTCKWVQG